jgi:alpha-glucosidase (family GH31 glycosyl hydrolase)
MLMNMYGIPVSGADICGFGANTNPELCARWTVVGSFSPFSRNHNSWGSTPQEPYVFAKDIYEGSVTYTDIMRMAIRNRYHLVRYYYTELQRLNQNGGTFYKPLFFEFPEDEKAYRDFELNIMLGSSLKLGVLSNNTEQN